MVSILWRPHFHRLREPDCSRGDPLGRTSRSASAWSLAIAEHKVREWSSAFDVLDAALERVERWVMSPWPGW